MELFGTRTETGKTYFDKYSMKQAIEERFILNPCPATPLIRISTASKRKKMTTRVRQRQSAGGDPEPCDDLG